MSVLKRMLCMIIAFALMCAGGFAQEIALDMPVSGIYDSGIIRVYLKSLGSPEAIYVTLAGDYGMENSDIIRFERGTKMVICADGENVLVSAGGMTLNMGKTFTMTRCAADEGLENGIYIYQSERHALYEGDLTVSCAEGKLRCMLSIGMEDYLKGVVAYEMSDSFPLEALKAQAVAARTYAMSRKAARVGAEYDVTDTTSDQVFKGFIADYENVIRAVEETAGIVGMYDGYYATCYYTASNGGQVATPNQIWGGSGDYGYIEQKDDPYDLENGKSLVNSFGVSREYDGENTFWQMLDGKFDVPGHEEVRLDRIISMELTEPRFEGSIMKDTLNVVCEGSYRDMGLIKVNYEGDIRTGWALGYIRIGEGNWYKWGLKDWKEMEVPVEMSFSVYEEIKDGLDIGLNSSDYEAPSVVETEDGYSIEMRRFGHGVGMSQRGAQVMAGAHGMSFTDILGFYYPGMGLEVINWASPELMEMENLPGALIRERLMIPPMEIDLGELGNGERFAYVSLDSARSRLNVRTGPSTDDSIAVKLDSGFRVVVCEDAGDGWVRIRGGSFTGYVKEEYLVYED